MGKQAVEIRMDSATVASWIKSKVWEIRGSGKKGANEMLIKCQLRTLEDLIREFGLKLMVTLVPSQKNKAEMLTRVKRACLQEKKDIAPVCCVEEDLKDLHNMHHFWKQRTLYLARKVNPNITMEAVKEMVEQCRECQSIDPAPTRHKKGKLNVAENWKWLAIDITLLPWTVPIHDWLWTWESSDMVKNQNKDSKRDRESCWGVSREGPVEEVLIYNCEGFHSEVFRDLCEKWGFRQYFRFVYRPSGNGIIERCHWTIKAVAKKNTNLIPKSRLLV